MPLRIACDLDGTLADMDAALQREAERLFGPDVEVRARPARPFASAAAPQPETDNGDQQAAALDPPAGGAEQTASGRTPLTERQMRRLWDHVRGIENFWTTLDEIEPGTVAQFGRLAAQRRWEVLFLTQRPATAGESAQRQSQRWLDARGFTMPAVYVVEGSRRGRVAGVLELDVVVDDRAENCLDVATDSDAVPILVWRGPARLVPPGTTDAGVQVAATFAQALAIIEHLDGRRQKRGVLSRIRSAFGL